MELDQEKFNTARELSDLGIEVAKAGALLSDLKIKTEEYLQEREAMADERVRNVLNAAKGLLEEAEQYQKTFHGYLETTGEVSREIREMLTSLSSLRGETVAFAAATEKEFAEKMTALDAEKKNIFLLREALDSDVRWVATQKTIINTANAEIADERGKIKRAYQRLNK